LGTETPSGRTIKRRKVVLTQPASWGSPVCVTLQVAGPGHLGLQEPREGHTATHRPRGCWTQPVALKCDPAPPPMRVPGSQAPGRPALRLPLLLLLLLVMMAATWGRAGRWSRRQVRVADPRIPGPAAFVFGRVEGEVRALPEVCARSPGQRARARAPGFKVKFARLRVSHRPGRGSQAGAAS
jgi:hypothetical protein